MLSIEAYNKQIAATRDERMQWRCETRFGMFIHFGLYSQLGRNEWAQVCENIPVEEFDLKMGFYTSLMDWHHPDGGRHPREIK